MTLARAALTLLASAAMLVVLVRLLEPRLAFFPFRGETTTPRDLGLDYEPLTIETGDGERLRAWLMPATGEPARARRLLPRQRRQPVELGADCRRHRPPGLLGARVRLSRLRRQLGASHRAEGSTATSTRSSITSGPKPPSPTVVYWGRSLGVSMAAYAATRHPPAGLILESGFPDARSLFRHRHPWRSWPCFRPTASPPPIPAQRQGPGTGRPWRRRQHRSVRPGSCALRTD